MGAVEPDQGYEYEEEDVPKRSTADAMRAIFDGAPGVATSVGDDAGLHDLEEEEEDEDEDDVENPWDKYDEPRWEPATKVNIIKGVETWMCPEHGSTYSPGICNSRAHVEAKRRKEKEREERQEAKKRRKEKAAEKREGKKARSGRSSLDLARPTTSFYASI